MTNTQAIPTNVCYHCGLTCPEPPIQLAQKSFCCEGCKAVYQLLHTHQLDGYYTMEPTAGTSFFNTTTQTDKYGFLDDAILKTQLVDFEDDKQVKVSFSIPQIHCASCIWLLEKLHKIQPAITHSRVNFLKKECYLTFLKKDISLRQVVELLAAIGYAPDINLGSLEQKTPSSNNRTLLYQLGIAGFCFGNIMLLSFPEYLGLHPIVDAAFSRFFGILNVLLALPIVFYSGKDYFKNAYHGLQNRHLNIDLPISLGILALFSRSIFEILSETGAGYLDSLAGLVFFLLIGKWFQQKTYAHLSFERDYRSYFPLSATKITPTAEQNVPVTQLQKGDTILVRYKELIPADAVLMSGKASIDYSFVTGETRPIRKQQGELIYAGGRQMGSAITLQLVKNVSQSYLTQLWQQEAFTQPKQSKLTQLADNIAHYFTPAILLIATVAAIYWLTVSTWAMALQVFTAVLIIACPCALALAAPFTLGNALRLLGKKQFFLKNIAIIEALARIEHLVFDKTGTLTQTQKSQVSYIGQSLNNQEKSLLKSLTSQSLHPISQSIFTALNGAERQTVYDFYEQEGMGVAGIINNQLVKIGNAEFVDKGSHSFSTAAHQTLAYVAIDQEVKGYFELSNHYRPHIQKSIQQLAVNYQLSLLSGDNEGEKKRLQTFFPPHANLLFRQSPTDKLQYINTLQKQGQKVAMLGDGLNDAGALQQADVGIAVTENVLHFSPACDAILEANQLNRLSELIRFCRQSVQTVRWAFLLSLLYNVIGLSIAVQGLLSPLIAAILMPLSSISIVLFGTIATHFLGRKLP